MTETHSFHYSGSGGLLVVFDGSSQYIMRLKKISKNKNVQIKIEVDLKRINFMGIRFPKEYVTGAVQEWGIIEYGNKA